MVIFPHAGWKIPFQRPNPNSFEEFLRTKIWTTTIPFLAWSPYWNRAFPSSTAKLRSISWKSPPRLSTRSNVDSSIVKKFNVVSVWTMVTTPTRTLAASQLRSILWISIHRTICLKLNPKPRNIGWRTAPLPSMLCVKGPIPMRNIWRNGRVSHAPSLLTNKIDFYRQWGHRR